MDKKNSSLLVTGTPGKIVTTNQGAVVKCNIAVCPSKQDLALRDRTNLHGTVAK